MRSQPRRRAALRTESSGYTLAGVAPGRKPYCGDRTSCTPSRGHGPRHSAWEGCRTIHLYQELRLGGGSIALGLPRLLIARPPSRPKSPLVCMGAGGGVAPSRDPPLTSDLSNSLSFCPDADAAGFVRIVAGKGRAKSRFVLLILAC
jgi:hypothetical protein